MNERNCITAAACQISAGAAIVTLLLFMTLQNRVLVLWYPLTWLCFGPALYGADWLFLRRERSVQALALFNGCAGAALFLAFLLLDGRRTMGVLTVTGIGCLILSVQAARLCIHPIKFSCPIQYLDFSLILLVLFSAYLGRTGSPMIWALPIAAGCGVAILGTLAFRTGGRLSSQNRGLLGILFAALSGGVWLGANTVSKGAGKGLMALWRGLKATWTALYGAFAQLMQWLASIQSEQDYGQSELEAQSNGLSAAYSDVYAHIAIPRSVYILIVLLILAVLVLLLLYVRRFHIRERKKVVRAVQSSHRSRVSLWDALKRELTRAKESLRLQLYLRRHRDTALGTFYGLLQRAYGRAWREGARESPREFLSELARQAGEDKALSAALIDLTIAVEQALYAPGEGEITYPQAALLRRRRKALFPRRVRHRF